MLILPAFKIGIFFEYFLIWFSCFLLKPVVPMTIFFLSLEAIFKISNVHSGTVKSIITSAFLNALSEFNSGLIPLNFLFISLFSVSETYLKFLFFFEDLISC